MSDVKGLVERLREGVLIAVETQPAITLVDVDGNEHIIGPSQSEIRQRHSLADEAADALASIGAAHHPERSRRREGRGVMGKHSMVPAPVPGGMQCEHCHAYSTEIAYALGPVCPKAPEPVAHPHPSAGDAKLTPDPENIALLEQKHAINAARAGDAAARPVAAKAEFNVGAYSDGSGPVARVHYDTTAQHTPDRFWIDGGEHSSQWVAYPVEHAEALIAAIAQAAIGIRSALADLGGAG